MRMLPLCLIAVLCFVAPAFGAEPTPPSKDAFLRSLSAPVAVVPDDASGKCRAAAGLGQQPSPIAAACSEGTACTNDLQCSPGACAGGECFCGCITNWPCGQNYQNCGLDGYCLRGACFCF